VRDIGGHASIEISPEELPRVADERLRGRLVAYFRELGFSSVKLDLEGYRTGKMNDLITKTAEEV
jgi:uncharacterized protein